MLVLGGVRQGQDECTCSRRCPALTAASNGRSGMLMLTGNGQAAADWALYLLPPCVMWPASMPSCMQSAASQYLLGAFPLRALGESMRMLKRTSNDMTM